MDRDVRDILEKVDKLNEKKDRLVEEIGWDNLPPGWDKESLMKFARSLTGKTKDDTEGFFTECVDRIKDEEGFDEEGAKKFCASLKDEYLDTTDWRTGPDGEED